MLHARTLVLCMLVVMLAGAVSCTPKEYVDPIPVILDRQKGFDARRKAAAQAEREMLDDPRRLAALMKLVWEWGYPPWQRQYAIDQLLIHDKEFVGKLKRRIILLRDWPTRKYVFDMAVQRGWDDFTPTLVRAYAQPVTGMTEEERPERGAIQKLNPDRSVEDVIFEVFANADSGYDSRHQTAAWALLNRLCDRETLMGYLRAAPDSNPLVTDLRATAVELNTLPVNREGVLRMMYLREPSQRNFWKKVRTVVGKLDDIQRRGLELRHIPVLVKCEPEMLRLTRSELVSRIEQRLQSHQHYVDGPNFDGQLSDHPQRFAQWRDALMWADLLTIEFAQVLLEDELLVAELFRQADQDLNDKTTEHGGVIDMEQMGPRARTYEPMAYVNDWKFVPSQKMVQDLYTGLFHFHFHAQDDRNGDHAGPGRGDMTMADNLRVNALVLTFIAPTKMNVDYYQPGKVVVDLGSIYR